MIRQYAGDLLDYGSISAAQLSAYLRNTGWESAGKRGRYADIFTKQHDGVRRSVAVPVFDELDDHADRVMDAIAVVSQTEGRAHTAVWQDLTILSNDSVWIASTNGVRYVPLSMSKSAELLRSSHDLMCNSARATEAAIENSPKAAFKGNFSSRVATLLDNIRFVHDHQSGYNLTLFSPVSGVGSAEEGTGYDGPDELFAAATTYTLATALDAAKTALLQSIGSKSTVPFQETIRSGVSANLCDALARLAIGGDGVAIHIDWSALRQKPREPQRASISHQEAEVLQSAANSLRREGPYLGQRVNCHVIQLARQPTELGGQAVLKLVGGSISTRIFSTFSAEDYPTLVRAFRDQTELGIMGDIYSIPKGFELRNPRIFASIQSEAGDHPRIQ